VQGLLHGSRPSNVLGNRDKTNHQSLIKRLLCVPQPGTAVEGLGLALANDDKQWKQIHRKCKEALPLLRSTTLISCCGVQLGTVLSYNRFRTRTSFYRLQ
jgi:hypothetical protein